MITGLRIDLAAENPVGPAGVGKDHRDTIDDPTSMKIWLDCRRGGVPDRHAAGTT